MTSAAKQPGKPAARVLSLREQQKELTRNRLIEAARTVFGRDGYSASRVEEITAAAGASRATFYLHFKTKADVVRELMTPLAEELQDLYRSLDQTVDPTWDNLRDWIIEATRYYERNRESVAIVHEAIGVEQSLAEHNLDSTTAGIDAMTTFLAKQDAKQRATAHLRLTLFSLQLGRVGYLWIVRGVDFDRGVTLNALTDSLHAAMHSVDRTS